MPCTSGSRRREELRRFAGIAAIRSLIGIGGRFAPLDRSRKSGAALLHDISSALARQTLHSAESGAVLASTGADAEPCSVLDSPHLPAALGFFKLFARPFCPELGKRGYQYDLRRTLAKASS